MTLVATLTRAYKTDKVTIGILQFEGKNHAPIYCLENPWEGNRPYVSCIPESEYIVNPYKSKKFPKAFKIEPVEDRTHILFHSGNVEDDTSGCILVGLGTGELYGEPAVLNSVKAMEYLNLLTDRKQFDLIIR